MCIICNKDSGYNRYYKKSESSVGYELYYCKYCINNGIFVLYTNIHNEFVLCGFKIAGNNRIMLSKNVNESIGDKFKSTWDYIQVIDNEDLIRSKIENIIFLS